MADNRHSRDPLENLLQILLSRKLLAVTGFLVVFTIAIVGVTLMPPTYEAYTSIFVSPPAISRIGLPLGEEVSGRSFLANQVSIIQSRVIVERAVYRLNLHRMPAEKNAFSAAADKVKSLLNIRKPPPNPVEEAIERLRDAMTVRLPRGTNILMITTKAQSPDFSALMANTTAKVYVEYAKELLTASTQSGYSFLEAQFEKTQEKLAAAQKELDEFNKREMSFIIPAEGPVIAQKLSQLEEQNAQIQAQIEYLKRSRVERPGVTTSGVRYANPQVKALEDELKKLNAEMSNALVYLKEDHPDVRSIRSRISQLETKIEEAAAGKGGAGERSGATKDETAESKELEELEVRKAFISGQIRKVLSRRQELAEKQAAQEKLEREAVRHRERAEGLKAAVEQARAISSTDLILESIKVVDEAFPPAFPERKKKMILLVVGFFSALVFGLTAALGGEYFDQSLKSADEAESYLDIAVLGVIPKIPARSANH